MTTVFDKILDGEIPCHRVLENEHVLAFLDAFDAFAEQVDRGRRVKSLDAYGAEDEAEFFAVASEAFFEAPDLLEAAYPAVYRQLRDFYRQDPLVRLKPFLNSAEPLGPSA